ncbi:hypothetical protein BD779DRAFT_1685601 [Infundibulicybe gibba]|nr:hypothetical protein BD779DRAFT_1685601 [Infundibulicybe gibba]
MTKEELEEHQRIQAMADPPTVGDSAPFEENIPTVEFGPGLKLGEGRRTLSWIWYTASDKELSSNAIHASICVEWVKA